MHSSTIKTLAAASLWLIMFALLVCSAALIGARILDVQILSVQSGSMAPALNKGDAVVLKRLTMPPQVGNIVNYPSERDAGVTITHRVVRVDRAAQTIVTRGDSSLTADKPIPMSIIGGNVQLIVPRAGLVLDFARSPFGLALLVYFPAISLVWYEVRRLTRYYVGKRYHLYGYASWHARP